MDKAKWTAQSRRRNLAALVLGFVLLYGMMQTGLISMQYQGIIITIGIYVLLAASLNLTTGVLGELVLGHAGFMSIGAYTAALFTLHMDLPGMVEFPLALLVGGGLAAVFGVFIGMPALRLRGDYLAIVTLAFGEIIKNLITVLYVGIDSRGLHFGIIKPGFVLEEGGKMIINGPIGVSGIDKISTFTAGFVLILVTLFLVLNLINSRHGRAIMAVRDNRIAADSVGVSTTRFKLMAFVISAACAGMAGTLYAMNYSTVTAAKFDFNLSILVLVFVVLGGLGNIWGSIIAAALLTLLPELLRALNFNDYRMLVYAILLIALMLFNNSGLKERLLERRAVKKAKAAEEKKGVA